MRANLSKTNPKELFLTPFLLPVFIANPSGYAPVINWYDRTPLTIHRTLAVTSSTVVKTTSFTYTVPANRRCLLESIQCRCACTNVGGGVGVDGAGLDLNGVQLVSASLIQPTAVGVNTSFNSGHNAVLRAGDILTGWYVVPSTSTYWLNVNVKGTEFDG